ncbi:MAG: hypothetical protein WC717_02515 [Candidatus Micrarchaeia archaeon]|jgi:hypothetical protein
MASKNALALAGAFLLLSLSFGCTDTSGAWKAQMMGWDLIVGVALAIVVLLLAIGYMAAVFMGDDRLKAWVGRELGQVFFSAVIIVAVVALVGSLDSWVRVLSLASSEPGWNDYVDKGVCCVSTPSQQCVLPAASEARGRACHIELATDYLQILYETARQGASSYLSNYGWFALLSRMSVSTTIVMKFMAGLNLTPFAGLEVPSELFAHLFDLSIKTMFLLRAQQIFLDFMWYPIFPVLISMGLVLRIFYFTRKLGGMLIALSLALYVVFPMFYVLSNAMLWGFMSHSQPNTWEHFGNTFDGDPIPASGSAQPIAPAQNAKGVFSQEALRLDLCSSSTQGEQDAMGAAMDNVRTKWDFLEGGRWYSQVLDFVTNNAFDDEGPIARLALLMVFTIFMPFLALMTSLASFKVLSPLLGGDVEISLLSRLI